MAVPLAVLADANVLVKDVVSFVLYDLCKAGVIDLRWTPQIEVEYVRHRARLRAQADKRAPDAADLLWAQLRMAPIKKWLVPNWLPPLWDADGQRLAALRRRKAFGPLLGLSDPDDVHVALAAADFARETSGGIILATDNLSDLPAHVLAPFGVDVLHPGDVLALAFLSDQARTSSSLRKTAADFRHPPFTPADMLRSVRSRQQFSNPALARRLATLWGLSPSPGAKPGPPHDDG
jgi:hypothetical protein